MLDLGKTMKSGNFKIYLGVALFRRYIFQIKHSYNQKF